MKTTTNAAVSQGLYMDNGGRIECTEHAPCRGSDSWVWDDWQPIMRAEALAFEREVGREPRCESCMAIARAKR